MKPWTAAQRLVSRLSCELTPSLVNGKAPQNTIGPGRRDRTGGDVDLLKGKVRSAGREGSEEPKG